jgi:hypothetical protein
VTRFQRAGLHANLPNTNNTNLQPNNNNVNNNNNTATNTSRNTNSNNTTNINRNSTRNINTRGSNSTRDALDSDDEFVVEDGEDGEGVRNAEREEDVDEDIKVEEQG